MGQITIVVTGENEKKRLYNNYMIYNSKIQCIKFVIRGELCFQLLVVAIVVVVVADCSRRQ